jgi:hypothetical protein
MKPNWEAVAEALKTASGIAWDGCHKIYVLMDDEQVKKMVDYGYAYDYVLSADNFTDEELLDQVQRWFIDSCGLRFVESVASVPEHANPNSGFITLVPQN